MPLADLCYDSPPPNSMKIHDLVPPALLDIKRRLAADGKVFQTYEEAIRQCGEGYSTDLLARSVVEKTRHYRDNLNTLETLESDMNGSRIAIAIGLAAKNGELNVLDFGGGAGTHYFFAKQLFRDSVKLNWSVVETEAMAFSADMLADEDLHFHTSIESAAERFASTGGVGLVCTSAALPYIPNPLETIRRLCNIQARNVFLTRFDLVIDREETIMIHESKLSANGPSKVETGLPDQIIKYPVTFCRKSQVEEVLKENYDLRLTFNEDRHVRYVQTEWASMYGFFARLKEA